MLNMVSTVDGHATLGGRSGPLSSRADRELFHGLRLAVDAVMVGAGTVRVERYGRIIRRRVAPAAAARAGPERGAARLHRLRAPRRCEADIPLLADPAARVAILTPSAASLPESAAEVDYVRAERDGLLDLPEALAELRERFGVRTLLCEGGPHLNAQLLEAGLVDELFLSLAPTLAGGDPAAGGEALRIVAGTELSPPLELELLSALESESHLFLRYAVKNHPPKTRRAIAAWRLTTRRAYGARQWIGARASAPLRRSASRARRCSAARSPDDALPPPPSGWRRSSPPPHPRRAPPG